MNGDEISGFLERIRNAKENTDTLLSYEPSVGKMILYLSMAAACDCADAVDPDKAVESDIEVIGSVTEFAYANLDKWSDRGLTFDKKPEFSEDEWLDAFVDAQGFLDDTIDAHVKTYGDTPEGKEKAFLEVSNILVYMISAICARCDNPDIPREFAEESVRKTYKFIREECTLIPKSASEDEKQ